MSSPLTLAISAKATTASSRRGALRGALEHVTWRVVGVTLAIAVARDAWSVMDVAFESDPTVPAAEAYLSATIHNLLMAFSIMFTTLVAACQLVHSLSEVFEQRVRGLQFF